MKKFDLNVYVQSVPDPNKPAKETSPAKKVKPSNLPVATVKAWHADEAMRKARRMVEGAGYKIRSIAMGPEGIVIVAFNNAKP